MTAYTLHKTALNSQVEIVLQALSTREEERVRPFHPPTHPPTHP